MKKLPDKYNQETLPKKMSKPVKAVIAVLCCISIIGVGIFGALKLLDNNTIPYTYGAYNSFMEGFTDVPVTDEKSAIEAVASIGDTLGIKDANSELKVAFTNKRGTDNYYRLQQYYKDIPVFGRNITVVADENGKSLGLTANYSPIEDVDITPSLNEEKINEEINRAYDGVDSQTNNGLIVYTLYDSSPTLAYDVIVSKSNYDEVIYEQCIISAKNGDILLRNSLIRTDLEHSLDEYTYKVNDKTYIMYDESRNILVLNSNKKLLEYELIEKDGVEYLAVSNNKKRNENANPLWDKNKTVICGDIKIEGSGKAKWKDNAVNLINSIENTYDFYSKILNWNGYDNKNSPMLSSYNDFFYSKGNNAYSQGNLLVFGYEKDLTDVGLIGHEFTHSVENSISGMLYSGESGAIMEAYSDIFGELAEDYAKDGILNGDCDWIHGSRNMINPSINKYPESYLDDNWGSTVNTGEDSDYGNVHTNNTVISHAAYLMSSGVDGNARIGNKSLAVMWFNALNMLQRDSDLSQCRNVVELSARIMLKNNQLTEEQYKTVIAAFERVGIENATFTYSKTVKNKFDLSVLSSKGTEDVHYRLEVIKMPTIKAGPGIINNEMPKLVMEEVAITGRQSLNLEDGTYVLRITDVSDTRNLSKSINIKIVVDGDNSYATDKIVVNTDFTDVIVVVLNDNSTENEDETADAYATSESSIDSYMSNKIIAEYEKIIERYDDGEEYDDMYSLYDIDKNGVPELFVWGRANFKEVVRIWSVKNEKAFKISTLKYEPFNIATIPGDNGIMILGWEGASIATLKNGNELKNRNILNKKGNITIDGKVFPDVSHGEIINDGGDPSVLIKGSKWLNKFPVSDTFMLGQHFKEYEDEKEAYIKIIDNYKNKPCQYLEGNYTEYSLYDIDNNGLQELILICSNTKHGTIYGNIYTIIDSKITCCESLITEEAFYKGLNDDGIVCKLIMHEGYSVEYRVYDMKNGVIPAYGKPCLEGSYEYHDDGYEIHEYFGFYGSPISEKEFDIKEAEMKKIERYDMDDLSAIGML